MAQYVLLKILDTTATQPLNFNRFKDSDRLSGDYYNTSVVLNATSILDLWHHVQLLLLDVFASATAPGIFYPIVLQNNLSEFSIQYSGIYFMKKLTIDS